MKILIIAALFLIMSKSNAQKIEWRGLYAGAQTISPLRLKEKFSHSVYLIGLIGIKRFTFNTQFIVPVFPLNIALIKFGIDYKLF